MNSGKGIIDKINVDTQTVIDGIIAEARAKAVGVSDKAQRANAAQEAECESGLQRSFDEIISRRETVARLDAKKIVMHAKRQAMDEIFAKAKETVAALPKKDYLNIIEKLIAENASDGDKVVPSSADVGRVNAKFIKNIAAKLNLNISLSDKVGDFAGGVILENGNYDKNLTLEAELEGLRNACEAEYAERIFKER